MGLRTPQDSRCWLALSHHFCDSNGVVHLDDISVLPKETYAAGIAFVQVKSAVPQTPQTSVTVTYTKAQTAGDLNVVVIGWNDSTAQISSVTDSKGNAYVLAVGPTVQSGKASLAIYYATTSWRLRRAGIR